LPLLSSRIFWRCFALADALPPPSCWLGIASADALPLWLVGRVYVLPSLLRRRPLHP
jgi:hypothetical protein